jgi:flagellar biosynthetic protein FliP
MEHSARGGATAPSRSAGTDTFGTGTLARTLRKGRAYGLLAALGGLSLIMGGCTGGTGQQAMPNVRVQVGGPEGGDSMSMGVQLLLLLTVLSLVPAVLMMVTSFVRIAIVLSFARSAIGMQQMPPNQVLLGLALFMTVFVMAPVWTVINESSLQPYLRNEIPMDEAIKVGQEPLREFMFKQTRERDLGLFVAMSRMPQPNTKDDVPTYALIPAFMISELKTAFQMGFIILLPFIVIDMVVSSALMSMGMMMLPPTTISLPFKVLLFVMADGWHLISRSLMTSFG